jgi:hypothetical protein
LLNVLKRPGPSEPGNQIADQFGRLSLSWAGPLEPFWIGPSPLTAWDPLSPRHAACPRGSHAGGQGFVYSKTLFFLYSKTRSGWGYTDPSLGRAARVRVQCAALVRGLLSFPLNLTHRPESSGAGWRPRRWLRGTSTRCFGRPRTSRPTQAMPPPSLLPCGFEQIKLVPLIS